MDKELTPEATQEEARESGAKSSKVSERKLKANRENAKKSTGPRDTSKTRYNAVTHGLLASKLMFDKEGKPIDPSLVRLEASLRNKYGHGDVLQELLIETTLVEYWRQSRAVAAEFELHRVNGPRLFAYSAIPNAIRYSTASRRSMLQALEALEAQKQQEAHDDCEPAKTENDSETEPEVSSEGDNQ